MPKKRGVRSDLSRSVRFLRGQLKRDPNNQKLKELLQLALAKLEEGKTKASQSRVKTEIKSEESDSEISVDPDDL